MPVGAPGTKHASSFRDPSGSVFVADGRIFRTIEPSACDDFQIIKSSGILEKLMSSGQVIATWPVKDGDAPSVLTEGLPPTPHLLVEHDCIPFISYPYEWPFILLKRAALHYLDLHLDLLKSNFTLSDASAYNIQFLGTRPIFIDILSIRPYREGEYWAGYRQFCEQFLNPLLLTALNGISHQSWFRGNTEGIPVEDMARVVPLHAKFSWRVQLHVSLHAKMYAKSAHTYWIAPRVQHKPMPKSALNWLLRSLRAWITDLKRSGNNNSLWQDYEHRTSYDQSETESKREFVIRYIKRCNPVELLDLGCNTGSYSHLALVTGVQRVIGIDLDQGAIDGAIARADDQKLNLLPLIVDAMSPSPNQGWAQREWLGFSERVKANGLLALAFLHHLTIGRNVPLAQAVSWLVALAPSGVVEFVPKNDPMVKQMLADRVDIFYNYNVDTFRQELASRASIVKELVVSSSGRTLFEFQR